MNYECPPQGGGAGAVMWELLDQFRNVPGVELAALCGWDSRFGAPPQLEGVHLQLLPVKRRSLHQTGLRAVGEFLWRGRHALRALPAGKYDLVHFHFSVPTGLLGRYLHNTPYVCSLHGIDVPGFVDEASALQGITSPLNRMVVDRAARVFAPSRQVASVMQRRFPGARIEVIPHGVAPERFRVKTRYATNARRFVTIARLLPWKRVDQIVSAVVALKASCPDATLDILGDGPELERLRRLIREASAESYIRLHGLVPRAQIEATLCEYDVFVLPSISEAFGLVYLEAMAAGLPIVAYDGGGAADVVEHGQTGLLLKDAEAGAVLAALQQLASKDGFAEALGRRARAVATSRFAWSVISEKYLSAYDSVLSRATTMVQ